VIRVIRDSRPFRVLAWCGHCFCEGELVRMQGDDPTAKERAEAAMNADLDESGACSRCRAAALGAA
jgi:hypothetical protein